MIDTDPQASLTLSCGVFDAGERGNLADVIAGAELGAILRELSPRLWLAPAAVDLASAELALVSRLGREAVLRKAMHGIAGRFDVALIDCPPSLGLLTVNALAAADGVIVPCQPAPADVRGMRLFLASIEQVRAAINPGLQVIGVLLTFYDGRLALHGQAVQALQGLAVPVLSVRIGRSVRVAEAAGAGLPVTTYDAKNPQSKAYQELGKEIDAWLSE
jgi:chromosome partitioning protein